MDARTMVQDKGGRVVSVTYKDTVEGVMKVLSRHNIGAAVVRARFGELLGIISERDIVRGLEKYGASAMNKEIHELMTSKVISCRPTDDLRDVMEQMRRYGVRHLPVAEGDSLEGMISMRDLIHVLLEEADLEAGVLQDAARTAVMARGVV